MYGKSKQKHIPGKASSKDEEDSIFEADPEAIQNMKLCKKPIVQRNGGAIRYETQEKNKIKINSNSSQRTKSNQTEQRIKMTGK